MNAETAGWSRRYQARLLKHLKQKPESSLRPAFELGTQAVALGLETLDVALIHGQVLVGLLPSFKTFLQRREIIERAKNFFTEALVPIEKTHPAAVSAGARANRLIQTLRERTSELSATTQHLKQGLAHRQKAESALKKSGTHRIQLLEKSRGLQNRVLHQTHQILSAQERQCKKTSQLLHGDIAQTLLAINLRLLTLKTSADANSTKLIKEIANTQQMVGEFTRKVKTAHS